METSKDRSIESSVKKPGGMMPLRTRWSRILAKTRWQLYFLLLVITVLGGGFRRVPALILAFLLSLCSRWTATRMAPTTRACIGVGLTVGSKAFCSQGWFTFAAIWWIVYWSGAVSIHLSQQTGTAPHEALFFGKLLGVGLSALYSTAWRPGSAAAPWCELSLRMAMLTTTLLLLCLECRKVLPAHPLTHHSWVWWGFGIAVIKAVITPLRASGEGVKPVWWVFSHGITDHWIRVIFLTASAVAALAVGYRWVVVKPPPSEAQKWQKWRYFAGRKYFHGVVSCLLVGLMRSSNVNFAAFVLLGVLCVYIIIEAARVCNLGGLGDLIERTLRPCANVRYADERDRGVLIVTPFLLLVGVATTVFLEVARGEKFDITLALTGMLATGVGDSFAALCGAIPGQPNQRLQGMAPNKTIRGTISFLISYIGTAYLVRTLLVDGEHSVGTYLAAIIISGIGAAVTEAACANIDNVYVSMVAYGLARITVWGIKIMHS